MQCPKCGFLMSAFDEDCPRCKNIANQPLPASTPQPQQPPLVQPQQTSAPQAVTPPITNPNPPIIASTQCKKCSYLLSPTDIECPRCKKVEEGYNLEKGALSAKSWETIVALFCAFGIAVVICLFILFRS